MFNFFNETEEIKTVEEENPKKTKNRGLFEHLKQVTHFQSPNYFDTLNDTEKKSWNTYMILRYLSMNPDWVEIINEIQPLTTSIQLEPKLVYQILIRIIPPSNIYLQYIKGKLEGKFEKELVDIFKTFYNISEKEALDYLHILYSKPTGISEVIRIVSMYGKDEKEIKKLIKVKGNANGN